MFQLNFQNQIFSTLIDFQNQSDELPDFAKVALGFCAEWLSGKEFFEQKTSGSTGAPKTIILQRAQMLASAKATQGYFHTGEHSKLTCCLPPNYIAGKMMLVRAMVWNCPIELVDPSSNPLIELSGIPDFVAMVPLQVEKCLTEKKSIHLLQQIKQLIIGGAPISENLKLKLLENHISAYQTYGMTETVSHIALAPITGGKLCYSTLPGVEIGTNQDSLLWVKSAMSGPSVIQTNDVVKLLSDKQFIWLGRADFVINSGGIKLHPEVLAEKASPLIHQLFPQIDFFFGSLPDKNLGEKLVLFLEMDALDEKKASDLKESLKSALDRFEVPKEILFKPRFERTPNGKLDRSKTSFLP